MSTTWSVLNLFFVLLAILAFVALCSMAWYPSEPAYYVYSKEAPDWPENQAPPPPPDEIQRGGYVYKLHRAAANVGGYRELDL